MIGLVLLLAAIFVAYKMVPVKVRAAALRGDIVDEAKSAGQRSDEQIIRNILRTAEQNDLPVGRENIEVSRSANTIRVVVSYTVPIEFPGYTYNWEFEHTAENPIF